jgi:hypothetical protein
MWLKNGKGWGMSRPNPFVLAVGLLLIVAAFGGLPLVKGGLYLDAHEGDSYHFLDILLRIEAGLIPHVDFPTPLGLLAFYPISVFMSAGFTAGQATILGQLSVALILLPLVVYVGVTRLSRPLAWLFGLLTLGLAVSLSYGGANGGASISMHYNRWAWAVSFVAVALALLPASGRDRPVLDSALIGLLGGVLAMIKATYFVALAPGIAVAVLMRWRGAGMISAILGGFVVALVVTVAFGPSIWPAYVSDLVTVLRSDVRPFVGVPLNTIISGASFVGITVLGVAMALMVRRSGQDAAGLAVLLLVPGFIYVTYQNFGNDPQWIWLLGIVIFALRPAPETTEVAGHDLRLVMGGAAWVALALNFPSIVANVTSTANHAAFDTSRFIPMLPREMGHQDIYIRKDRAYTMTAQVHLDREQDEWAEFSDTVQREPLIAFEGVTLPQCEWMAGSRAYFERLSRDLVEAGFGAGSQLYVTDILSAFWMFGPFDTLEGGAPWYYGGLTGLENADYVLIPKCSFVARVRGIMVEDLQTANATYDLVRDNALYALFAVDFDRGDQE